MAVLNAMSGRPKQNNNPAQLELSNMSWAITHSILLALCCFFSYKIITGVLGFSRFVPRDDELLGGMWAVIATIFVFRYCYKESIHAAPSRTYRDASVTVAC